MTNFYIYQPCRNIAMLITNENNVLGVAVYDEDVINCSIHNFKLDQNIDFEDCVLIEENNLKQRRADYLIDWITETLGHTIKVLNITKN